MIQRIVLAFTSMVLVALAVSQLAPTALAAAPFPFAATSSSVAHNADMEAAVIAELGPQYRVADWNDIVSYYDSGSDMSLLTEVITSRMWVYRNGAKYYSSSRHYFINLSNHSTPSGFLVHAHIDNHLIDLGSWDNPRRVLAYTDSSVRSASSSWGRIKTLFR
jgi:hypothetical protein